MQSELQYKAPGCVGGDCPARRKVTSAEGGYLIVGKRLSPADRAQVPGVGQDEDVIWVPDGVIEQ